MKKIINENSFNFLLLIEEIKNNYYAFTRIFPIGLLLILVIYFFSDKLYTSQAIIAPVNDSSLTENSVSSVIAGSIGLGTKISISPETIFLSEEMKKNIIYKKRKTKEFESNVNLITYWEIDKFRFYNPLAWFGYMMNLISEEKNQELTNRILEAKAIKLLEKRIDYDQDFYSNAITISTTMEERLLAQDINNDIINYINQFLVDAKNKNASSEIFYLNKRIKEVKNILEKSENTLQIFEEDNSNYLASPKLTKEFTRLVRDVELNSTILIQLESQVEIKKLNEVSEVANFVVVDHPSLPPKKIWPRLSNLLIGLIIVSFLCIIFLVLYKDLYIKDNSQNTI